MIFEIVAEVMCGVDQVKIALLMDQQDCLSLQTI